MGTWSTPWDSVVDLFWGFSVSMGRRNTADISVPYLVGKGNVPHPSVTTPKDHRQGSEIWHGRPRRLRTSDSTEVRLETPFTRQRHPFIECWKETYINVLTDMEINLRIYNSNVLSTHTHTHTNTSENQKKGQSNWKELWRGDRRWVLVIFKYDYRIIPRKV